MTSIVASSPDGRGRGRASGSGGAGPHLLISIHDVTPALDAQVRALWSLCRDRGVTPALLVVPNWHGAWPLDRAPEFARWVRECAASGAEVFLHGERHDEVGSPRGWRDAARAWGKTAREGEFLTLDESAARERIERGVALLNRLAIEPTGFVAPAWLTRPDGACARAVAAAGLLYSEDDRAVLVHRPDADRRVPSPVVRWSSRTTARAYGSAMVAAARWHIQRTASWVRLALHPSDLDHPVTARSTTAALDRWLANRRPSQYADL